MEKNILPLSAALLLFCAIPFFAAAQTGEERNPPPSGEAAEVPLRIDSGRFGAEEPPAEDPDSGTGKTYTNQWLFLGARLGPSLRFYTPQDDTAFTGGDTYGFSLDMGIQASLQIAPVFSIQAEMVFTWDNASVWEYFFNDKKELDRYTREFTSFSLQFPLTARLNFYSGKFRISPFFGGYVLVPLGPIKTNSSVEDEDSFSWSVSPPLGLLGGLNVGFPLGPGMIFADIRYAADLGEPELDGGDGIHAYRRHMGSLSIGYEFGFFKKR